jgi:hypothetical protein
MQEVSYTVLTFSVPYFREMRFYFELFILIDVFKEEVVSSL